ncbi:glycoside hydrolase family 55 protein [Granulicella rosea]|nr:glycoside hydrolase family 55 protein [Granulicella rosea]
MLSVSQTINIPSDANVVNVQTYGAVGDGVTDDTAAIQSALEAAAPAAGLPAPYTGEYKYVYFPSGTYLISAKLTRYAINGSGVQVPDYGFQFLGQDKSNTILKLKDNTFTSTTTATPMIETESLGYTHGVSAFHNSIENMTIDAGSGNPGATAISYLASNMAVIRNVVIQNTSSSGSIGVGIDMTRLSTGPALIENVTVNGFAHGIQTASALASITLEHISLINQTGDALVNTDNVLAINELYTDGSGKAIANLSSGTNQVNGLVVVSNSSLNSTTGSSVLVSDYGAIVFHNTTFSNGQTFLSGGTAAEGVLTGSTTGALTWSSGTAPLLSYSSATPVVDTPVPAYDASGWVAPAAGSASADFTVNYSGCAHAYGCLPSGTSAVDATSAIQSALNSGASTIYLPHGVYYVSAPLNVPTTVNRIIGFSSSLRVMSTATSWPAGQGVFHIATAMGGGCPGGGTCAPLVIEKITFDATDSSYSFNHSPGYAFDVVNPSTSTTATQRDVVLRDIHATYNLSINRQTYGGRVFLENFAGGSMLLAGSNLVAGRHFNSETHSKPAAGVIGTTRINNNGAPLWLLGFKTEGPVNIVDNTAGSVTEVLGGFFYTAPSYSSGADGDTVPSTTCANATSPVPSTTSTPSLFIDTTGSQIEASFVEEVSLLTENGVTQLAADRSFPFYAAVPTANTCQAGGGSFPGSIQRGPGAATGEAGHIVPHLKQ